MFIFNYEGVEVKIRNKTEFNLLSDEEKVDYLNEGLEENEYDFVLIWLRSCIPEIDESDFFNIFYIQEKFMEKFYPDKLTEICKQTNSERVGYNPEKYELIDDFIIEVNTDGSEWELFFVNEIYENSTFYRYIEDEALGMEGVKVTH